MKKVLRNKGGMHLKRLGTTGLAQETGNRKKNVYKLLQSHKSQNTLYMNMVEW